MSPLIIVPRKNPIKEYVPPKNVIVQYKQNSKTFDSNIMVESFVRRVFLPHTMHRGQTRSRLYLDQARCNTAANVAAEFKKNNINISYIPARMTALLQPADVGWFSVLKREYAQLWEDWMINSPKTYTKQGNLKSPGYVKV